MVILALAVMMPLKETYKPGLVDNTTNSDVVLLTKREVHRKTIVKSCNLRGKEENGGEDDGDSGSNREN